MTSIYEQVLGDEFSRLHPKIQQRFGFASGHGLASIGRGVMTRIWHGPSVVVPFLYLGAARRIMFPESGQSIPFVIQNHAYVDGLGRETMSWLRTFYTSPIRRFDAYMIYSPERGKIIDYLGTLDRLDDLTGIGEIRVLQQ